MRYRWRGVLAPPSPHHATAARSFGSAAGSLPAALCSLSARQQSRARRPCARRPRRGGRHGGRRGRGLRSAVGPHPTSLLVDELNMQNNRNYLFFEVKHVHWRQAKGFRQTHTRVVWRSARRSAQPSPRRSAAARSVVVCSSVSSGSRLVVYCCALAIRALGVGSAVRVESTAACLAATREETTRRRSAMKITRE